MKNIIRITIFVALAAVMAACGGQKEEGHVPVTEVKINRSVAVTVGESRALSFSVLPSNATLSTVTWSSDDSSVATVSPAGTVKGISVGKTTVNATAEGITAQCVVTVKEKEPDVPVATVTVSPDKREMYVTEKFSLHAAIAPPHSTVRHASWTSNNESVASVDYSTGEVTAKAVGEAVITAEADGVTGVCEITVTPIVNVTGVIVTPDRQVLSVGESFTPAARVLPENASIKTVTWSSSAFNVASVDPQTGSVTGVSRGVAYITATSHNKQMFSCMVTVY